MEPNLKKRIDPISERVIDSIQELDPAMNHNSSNRDQGRRVSHVVQESTVVLKDIFRKYPNRYDGCQV